MELLLTEEQVLLREAAAALFERAGSEAWPAIAEAGWPSLLADSDLGGVGLGATELALALEQSGRHLCETPLAGVTATAAALAAGDSAALRETLLPEVLAGRRVVVPAFDEGAAGLAADGPGLRAAPDAAGGIVLDGVKTGIACARDIDGYLVNAAAAAGGAILVHVPRDTPGTSLSEHRTIDQGAVGRLTFEAAALPASAVIARGEAAIAATARIGTILLIGVSAELLGVMARAGEIAVEYTKVRRQFDRPIGSFQALQHRAVEDYVRIEVTRSLVYQTAQAVDEDRARPEMLAALKAKASENALVVAKSAIQMHGAIGFTDEHEIGRYLKRAMTLAARHGNAAAHRARYAGLAL